MDKKSIALDRSYGGAVHRLRKLVLFKLLSDHGLNVCYRCKKMIESPAVLSMEHKDAWYPSKERFWDLDNIAFSHLACNIGAARRTGKQLKQPTPHGTHGGYAWYDCRCDSCRGAHKLYMRRYRDDE